MRVQEFYVAMCIRTHTLRQCPLSLHSSEPDLIKDRIRPIYELSLYFRDGQIVHNPFLLFDPLALVNNRIAQVLLEVFDGASFQISPEDPTMI